MRDDRFEEELRELLDADEASAALPEGWEQRASERLAALRLHDPGPRARWQTVAIAGLVVAALGVIPYSTDTARAPALVAMAAQQAAEAAEDPSAKPCAEASPRQTRDNMLYEAMRKALAPYRGRAVIFVRERYPNDPEMLMAAGLLAKDKAASLGLLKEAAETANTPVAWAAYVSSLLGHVPRYERLGTQGVDPGDPEIVAQAKRDLAERGQPDALTANQVEPLLAALKGWQAADPQNAMPAVLEVFYLYGLHEDAEALERWRFAASLPLVSSRDAESRRPVARLLSRMGMPELEAIERSYGVRSYVCYPTVRECARIAVYEGRLAQMQGRSADAIAWWDATIAIGHHMQESATHLIDYLVGVAVEGIGAAPTWKWYLGAATGMEDGPLLKGRYFWGRQHEFFVTQVGETADRQVRDDLVLAKVRQMAHRRLREPFLAVSLAVAWMSSQVSPG